MEQAPLHLDPDLERRTQDLGLEFMAKILELETRRNPRNVDALAELGHVYTRQGRFDEGLAVDRQLVRLVPENPTVHYNLACSLAILGHRAEALEALEQAVDRGYDDVDFMLSDDDLGNIRTEAGFRVLVERIQDR